MLIVVLSLIEVDDRILLVQEAKASCVGTWFLPGGHLEQRKSLADCARREVREAAGLDVELAEQSSTVLPMSLVHTLTPSESGREKP